MKRFFILIFSGILLILPYFTPTPSGLSVEGYKVLAVFLVSAVWWVTEVVPLMITSIFAMAMLILSGSMKSERIFSFFGNSAVFFILGSLILASAFMRSGLSKRLALLMMKKIGKSKILLPMGILLISAFLSTWMSSHAVAAMMFPIILSISSEINDVNYEALLFFSMMWGTITGGNLTFLGGARAVLAVEIMNKTVGKSISFLGWMKAVYPLVLVEIFVALVLVYILGRNYNVNIPDVREEISKKLKQMGPFTSRERMITVVILVSIFCWVIFGSSVGLATISLLMVVIVFILKLVSWEEVEEDVNWGIILMYGGAIVLGKAMNASGVSQWILSTFAPHNDFLFLTVVIITSAILTELVSNSAVVAFALPVVLSASSKTLPPQVLALSVTVSAGLSYMLPMSTPDVAIAMSSGKLRLKDTAKYGAIMSTIGVFLIIFLANVYWRYIF